jgi:DNA-binding NarL/FixJ family response regulator
MPRILIADDNEALLSALKGTLSSHPGWTICGEATNGRSAVVMALDLKPDLIVLDFLMPLLNGLAAATEILKSMPGVPIVLYTMHMSGQLEREAERVGIRKVVSKTEPFQDLIGGLENLLSDNQPKIGPLALTPDCGAKVASLEEAVNNPLPEISENPNEAS